GVNDATRSSQGRTAGYELVVFDMDGTLVDSFGFFIRMHNLLSAKYCFQPLEPHNVELLRHLSPREIMAHVGMPRWKLPFVARDFVRLMRLHGQDIHMFPGVDNVLRDLHARGIKLAVVTSNSVENCRRILGEDMCRLMSCIDGVKRN